MITAPDWLRKYFEAENNINFDKILSGEYEPKFQQLLAPLVRPACEERWPILLPMSNHQLRFYAAARNARDLLELQRVLGAFLGSSDTHPDLLILHRSEDPAEQALLERAPAGLIKFTLLDQAQTSFDAKSRVFRALAKVIAIYDQRPELASTVRRPSGRVLRDFLTACQAQDGQGAFRFFEELKGSGSLSQRNLLSLELQALAASQQWKVILEHPQLTDLLSGRLPVRLVRILLRALGQTGLYAALRDESAFPDDFEKVRSACEPLSPLFLAPPAFEHHSGFVEDWRLWAFGAAALGFNDFARHLPAFLEREWVAKLSSWAGLEPLSGASEGAATQIDEGPVDLGRATQLLQGALIASPDQLDRILALLETMPIDLREQLANLPRVNSVWQSLVSERRAVKSGWSQWFMELFKPDARIQALGEEALTNSQHWQADSFDADQILKLLQTHLPDEAGIVLRNTLPLLLEWLGERQIGCNARFWISWLELLAMDEIVSVQDFCLAYQLVARILSQPHGLEEYRQALEAIEVLWEKGNSIAAYPEILDLIEMLLEATCPAKDAIRSLWHTVQNFALRKWNRLEVSQRYLTKCLASEVLGEEGLLTFQTQPVSDDTTLTPEQMPNLKGKLLAIYSLTEGAARRARSVLESMFSGLAVEVNHDHTATATLINLAKRAEYFVFAANSAKHQAFNPVSKVRSDLIYPQGKGSSSIIKAFLNEVL